MNFRRHMPETGTSKMHIVGRRARALTTTLLSATLGACLTVVAACGGSDPSSSNSIAKPTTNSGDVQTGPAGLQRVPLPHRRRRDQLAFNNNASPATTNSTLRILLAAGSGYEIGANNFTPDASGEYTLSSETAPVSVTNCDEIWVTKDITAGQALETTDCSSPAALSDEFLLTLQAGESVTLTRGSPAFDPSISLVDEDGNSVGSDVDTQVIPPWSALLRPLHLEVPTPSGPLRKAPIRYRPASTA
jgi:hypothetical protein